MFNGTMKLKSAIKPRALRLGDRVALIAPASRPRTPAVVERCRNVIRQMGFEPVVGANVLNMHGFMAGTDDERLADFTQAVYDDSIAAIVFMTGGYGGLHLLSRIDFDAIERRPKVFLGCDDNTVLLNAINVRTGLVTFHGPNVEQIKTTTVFDAVKHSLMSNSTPAELNAHSQESGQIQCDEFYCPVEGLVEGRLLGGNLTALASLLGTRFEPNFRETILFLEDINEQNGILDRWFTSLYLAGHLQSASGIAFGSFENCSSRGAYNMLSVMDTFSDRLKYLRKPGCFGLPFGQTAKTNVVPIGINARLDCAAGRLEFFESALG